MNQQDRKEFEIVHLKIDELKKDIVELKTDMEKAHSKTDENLSFIKENLFNPNQGLWAETKENTRYRQDSQKWRMTIGAGFIGLFFKQIYDFFSYGCGTKTRDEYACRLNLLTLCQRVKSLTRFHHIVILK